VINLVGLLITGGDGVDGQVQLTIQGEDGTPMRYQYSGDVYASVDSNSRGYLKVHVNVTPPKQDTVARNAAGRLFDE
jgi:hypothetical protein